jgi:hypothetical protein
VVQAYKKMGMLARALATATAGRETEGSGGTLPLHISVAGANYENTVLLLKECREHSPKTLTATVSGSTLLHLAASRPEGVPIVKFLLRECSDVCSPMLLAKDSRGLTPLQVATSAKFSAEFSLKNAESFARTIIGKGNMPQFTQDRIREQQTDRPRRMLEQAKETVSLLNEPTMMARTAEAERQTKLMEEQKLREKEEKITKELRSLVEGKKWGEILADYTLSSCEVIQTTTLKYLASTVSDSEASTILPPLTPELMKAVKRYMSGHEDDPVLKSCLVLLAEFSNQEESSSILLSDSGKEVLSLVLRLLRSLHTDLQRLCVSILHHVNTEDN